MRRPDWPVNDASIRPITRLQGKEECTYCGTPKGDQHKAECVMRERSVVIKVEVEYVIKAPEHWVAEDLENHRNEGRWCASNIVGELSDIVEKGNCLCDHTKVTFVREATEDDERTFSVYVVESES